MSDVYKEEVAWLPPEIYGARFPRGAYVGTSVFELDELNEWSEVVKVERVAPDLSKLVVCVNDNPHDAVDGTAHFELYDGDEADYFPYKRLRGHIDESGESLEFVPDGSGELVNYEGVGAIPREADEA